MSVIILPDGQKIYLGSIWDIERGDYNVIFSIVEKDHFDKMIKKPKTIYEHVDLSDTPSQIVDLLVMFTKKLDSYLGNRVAIHCFYGQSRTPAFAIGFLILKYGMTFPQAYRYIKDRYPKLIITTPSFIEQLQRLGEEGEREKEEGE